MIIIIVAIGWDMFIVAILRPYRSLHNRIHSAVVVGSSVVDATRVGGHVRAPW